MSLAADLPAARLAPRPDADLRDAILRHAAYSVGARWERMTEGERFRAVGFAVRDRLISAAVATLDRYRRADAKSVFYLSMEFLIGRSLENNLVNLGLLDEARAAVADLGSDFDTVAECEHDAALGNGGLGRLAACFLDSMATLGLPGFGLGILYDYGLFKQEIRDGRQVERPDSWLTFGSPWLVERPERACAVRLYGQVVNDDPHGGYRPRWAGGEVVLGIPHDLPIVGYGGMTVNLLRLFSARAPQELDLQAFNEGEFLQAASEKSRVETICKVLYPNDSVEHGPELRLVQEYFLVACSIQTILKAFRESGRDDLRTLPDFAAAQLNDTHPALAVAELMRVLVDEHRLSWDDAWTATTGTLAYTNHTLMPEALERWPVSLLGRVLPRHLELIFEINRRLLDDVAARHPGDGAKLARMSLIEEGPTRQVRMAHLAIVGGHSVNGVAEIHSELVKTKLVPDFYEYSPEKFNNKTNGVTPRRWLLACNPGLADLLDQAVGPLWPFTPEKLRKLERYAEDAAFLDRFLAVKLENKRRLARFLKADDGHEIDPSALLDVQVKRIHLYKRQLLKLLHVVYDYLRIVEDGWQPPVPRTVLFAGKAAPSYAAAKEVIHAIHVVAARVNSDPRVAGALRVVFARDYRVTLAEQIVPAADLSEQISTAGTEASGTSCMKLAMNGALTVGTLDGANIEILREVGSDNMFIFGKTVAEIAALASSSPRPDFAPAGSAARRLLDAFLDDRLSPGDPGRLSWIPRSLADAPDPYFHLADLDSYLSAQDSASLRYADPPSWARSAILNVARTGRFSSDRTIAEYARDIWDVRPVLDRPAATITKNGEQPRPPPEPSRRTPSSADRPAENERGTTGSRRDGPSPLQREVWLGRLRSGASATRPRPSLPPGRKPPQIGVGSLPEGGTTR